MPSLSSVPLILLSLFLATPFSLSSDHFSLAHRTLVPSSRQAPSKHFVPDDAFDAPPGHEEMLFYRGFARLDPSRGWIAQMRAVFIERPVDKSLSQRAMQRAFDLAIRPDNRLEELRARNRLSYFFADTLGDRYHWLYGLKVKDGDRLRAVSIRKDGSFESNSTLIRSSKRAGDVLEIQWQPPNTVGAPALQTGRVHLYGPTGYSIIADIDDTIKDSRVISIPTLLKQTFLKTFEPVPFMPELFRHFQRTLSTRDAPDVAFHYISSTPYSLLPSLDHFLANRTFPLGPIHLDELRVKEVKTLIKILNQVQFKLEEGRRVAQTYPERKIILIGDSVQHDAKAFGKLMREDPDRKHYICTFILLTSGVKPSLEKKKNRRSVFEKAFQGVDPSRYYMFSDPRELMSVDIPGGSCKPRGKASTDIGTFPKTDDDDNDDD